MAPLSGFGVAVSMLWLATISLADLEPGQLLCPVGYSNKPAAHSVNVIVYPVEINMSFKEDTVLDIHGLLVNVTNAPTQLRTIVTATSSTTISGTSYLSKTAQSAPATLVSSSGTPVTTTPVSGPMLLSLVDVSLRKRQDGGASTFMGTDGSIVSNCSQAASMTVDDDGQLWIGGQQFSTNPGVIAQVFVPSSQVGSITATFTAPSFGWTHDSFNNGSAVFCVQDETLYVQFTSDVPASCQVQAVAAVPASECTAGTFVSASSALSSTSSLSPSTSGVTISSSSQPLLAGLIITSSSSIASTTITGSSVAASSSMGSSTAASNPSASGCSRTGADPVDDYNALASFEGQTPEAFLESIPLNVFQSSTASGYLSQISETIKNLASCGAVMSPSLLECATNEDPISLAACLMIYNSISQPSQNIVVSDLNSVVDKAALILSPSIRRRDGTESVIQILNHETGNAALTLDLDIALEKLYFDLGFGSFTSSTSITSSLTNSVPVAAVTPSNTLSSSSSAGLSSTDTSTLIWSTSSSDSAVTSTSSSILVSSSTSSVSDSFMPITPSTSSSDTLSSSYTSDSSIPATTSTADDSTTLFTSITSSDIISSTTSSPPVTSTSSVPMAWSLLGCYNQNDLAYGKWGFMLAQYSYAGPKLTYEGCIYGCAMVVGPDVTFMGLTETGGGWCLCSNEMHGSPLDASECNTPCDGNSAENCGGTNGQALVYAYGPIQVSNTSSADPAPT